MSVSNYIRPLLVITIKSLKLVKNRVRIGRHPFEYMDTPLGYRDTLLQHVIQ
jgi:hypothetical protein